MTVESRHEPLPGVVTPRLRGWLESVVERGASDLLLVADAQPGLKINGAVTLLSEAALLTGDDIAAAVAPALPLHARRLFAEEGIADGSLRVPELGRFRINLHHERGRVAAAIRRLPQVVPSLGSLGLPAAIEGLTQLRRGLVLVGGQTG